MGGVHDHRNASGHTLLDALVQPLLDVHPGALHRRIPEDLRPDRISGEHLRRRLTGGGE